MNIGIIKWVIPGTTKAIFEWDEDYSIGTHYHAMLPEANIKCRGDYNPRFVNNRTVDYNVF